MGTILKHPGVLISLQMAACWPVWHWNVLRMSDGSDEPLGILALVAAVILVVSMRQGRILKVDLIPASILLFLYAFTYPFSPPLVRAVLAVTALSLTLSSFIMGIRFHFALTGLLLLSLPVVSSLQFYLGYPLRVLCGFIALPMLGLAGYPVVLEGTSLRWGDIIVAIDAPCSGIRMLWAGLFLAFTLASIYRLRTAAVVVVCSISICLVILANSLRTTSLFLLEVLPVQQIQGMHDMTGLVIFAFMGLVMIGISKFFTETNLCTRISSS